MKKQVLIKYAGVGCLSAALFLTSCEDFLDRPTSDNFTIADFYQNEQQVKEAANTFYGSPWFDWQRGMLAVGDALGGNYYKGSTDVYTICAVAGAGGDENLTKMSEALWSIIGHANSTIYNINNYAKADEKTKNTAMGEVMLMKAAAYFYLVRSWGDIPIISDNATIIAQQAAFDLCRYKKEDVYKYILATIVKAAELLPEKNDAGRVDKTSAYGLLSKVYLTAAGVSGSLNNHYLEKAIEYGEKVFDDPNHQLEPTYANLFRVSTGDCNPEGLITLHWNATYTPYTSINMQHCDLAPGGSFNGTGNNWGSWGGVTVDLLNLFGEDPLVFPGEGEIRKVNDPRRLACATMFRDYQPLWYRDTENDLGSNGFYVYIWGEKMTDKWGVADFESPTGACAGQKNIHGNIQDHIDECNVQPTEQGSNTPIHYLRAADVYLCMAEACYLLNGSVSGKSLQAFNAVYKRAMGVDYPNTIDYDAIWNERRKELAFEGDMWFNYVKRSYYNEEDAVNRLVNVERGAFEQINLKDYYDGKLADTEEYKTPAKARENGLVSKKVSTIPQNAKGDKFVIPFPDADLTQNPRLNEDSQNYDLSQVDYYDESKL